MGVAYSLLDRGTIPDVALRPIIRSLCRERLGKITRGTTQERHERKMEYIAKLKAREVIADKTAEANEQHYEVSTLPPRSLSSRPSEPPMSSHRAHTRSLSRPGVPGVYRVHALDSRQACKVL